MIGKPEKVLKVYNQGGIRPQNRISEIVGNANIGNIDNLLI
jgi:hypothetical protein